MAISRPARHEKTKPIYPLGNKTNFFVMSAADCVVCYVIEKTKPIYYVLVIL
jgi:hypothetical protein